MDLGRKVVALFLVGVWSVSTGGCTSLKSGVRPTPQYPECQCVGEAKYDASISGSAKEEALKKAKSEAAIRLVACEEEGGVFVNLLNFQLGIVEVHKDPEVQVYAFNRRKCVYNPESGKVFKR